jgi:ComF family protein
LPEIADDIRLCSKCLIKRPKYEKLISILKYNKLAKKLISDFKYHDRINLSLFFTSTMINKIKEIEDKIDYIAPVPLHKKRLISRRYNQSAIIGKQIAKKLNFNFVGDLLNRTKNTKSQNKLKKNDRFKNTKGVFEVSDSYQKEIREKNILLIDDIVTTEATINNCCLSLLKYAPKKIYICSIAKTY